ncbi:hypothetical protein ACFQZJ_06240 [Maribacter chungangensis]|uniref:DUF1795 domain-containing protein n=1 Tax=Maribacter chungangensis TaxID=1069117 RepID=A0ABW3B153_9FLAO
MKKAVFIYVALLLSFSLYGQQNIANETTAAHVVVQNTKISLVPPVDFSVATNFAGFQQDSSGASIMVVDLPAPFSEIAKAFTPEGLKTQGMDLLQKEELILNGIPAILIKGEQAAYGNTYHKYTLAFGSETESILINGTYQKEDDAALGEAIKSAVLSSIYDTSKSVDPLESADFEIALTGTDMVFAASVANSLLFNREGQIPGTATDKAAFIVAKSFSEMEIPDKKAFSENRLRQNPITIESIKSTVPIRIDGLDGFEIIAESKPDELGKVLELYQVILFSDKQYYILFGSSEEDYEKNMAVFKSLTQTFKRK